ncbi:MAG: hypothetical protein KatS3mg124_1838 [Porticoccaceae bacterium]|nr:MAG: hypothetical protein KatS3mg124_1838 [Porticoccaceae bacterium]
MSLQTYIAFRQAYLAEAASRLEAIDLSGADTPTFLAAGALYKMAASVAEMDILGPGSLDTLSAFDVSDLDAWLQGPGNRSVWNAVLEDPQAWRSILAHPGAMATVAGSAIAMEMVAASTTAMSALAGSPSAMAIVAASSTAMQELANSINAMSVILSASIARVAVYDSDVAWAAIAASQTARDRLKTSATTHSTASTAHVHPAGVTATSRVVLLEQKAGDSSATSYAGANADTYATNSTTYIERFARVTGLTHRTSDPNYNSYVRFRVMD